MTTPADRQPHSASHVGDALSGGLRSQGEVPSALGRFRPYPKYAESGVEWLGKIPSSWQVKRLKFLAAEPIKNGIGEAAEHDNPEWPRYVRITDIAGPRELRGDTFKSLPPDLAAEAPFKVGDLLLAAVGATFGKSYLHVRDCGPVCFAGYMVRFSPCPAIDPGYAAYWTESGAYWALVQSRVVQATIQNFSAAKYKELAVPLPSLPEQRAIAAFLDGETARIDELVAKKQRLIELLEEQRAALITHAVTKGLDPKAPLKESRVEYLGEIPAHWDIGRLRRFWSVIDCKHRTAVYVADGIPIVSTTEVKPGRLLLDGPRRVTATDFVDLTAGGRKPKRGDVIYSRNASLGSAAYVDTDEPFCMGQDVCLITSDANNLYLAYQLNSRAVLSQIEAVSVGSTFDRINVAQIKDFWVAVPPVAEQRMIAAFLDAETFRIDALVAKVRDAIARLLEFRVAIISAVVTGKIDVREEAA